jgi:hypothetical protein
MVMGHPIVARGAEPEINEALIRVADAVVGKIASLNVE